MRTIPAATLMMALALSTAAPAIAGPTGEPVFKRFDLKYVPARSAEAELKRRFPDLTCAAASTPTMNLVLVYADPEVIFNVQKILADLEEQHSLTTP